LAEHYRIERELGAGGMATVYLAEDLKHDRKVAIKVLKPELAAVLGADRFVVEIKTTAALQHPHILPLFDSGTADGFLFYVMPYIQGETIREKLNRETQFGVDEAVRITREIADALDYAHRHGVIHRDIKPENILLHDGRAMVMDFGIALAVSAAAGGRMTETGLSLGTPHYMSPEQATAEKEISGRSDVYSLASVLYEMLTGDPPFTASSAQAVIMKIITEQPAPVTTRRKSVPLNVTAAVAKALEKLPADRFPSAADFSRALMDPAFSGAGTLAVRVTSHSGRRRWDLAAAAIVGLAAGAAGIFAVTRPASVTPQVVRFGAPLQTSQRLNNNSSYDMPFVLSPDGTRIAYVAFDSGSALGKIHVRQLDQLTAVSLPGTDDAIDPFFSPDGKWIGFIGQRDMMLRKVAVTGGPVSIVVRHARPNTGAPSWGDDNSIAYTDRAGNLFRIAAGASPETLLTAARFGAIGAPKFLPGSRAMLIATCRKDPASPGVCVGEIDVLDIATRKTKMLIENALRGWYVPGGYLVFGTNEGGLYGVRFDVEKLTIAGAPVALLDGIGTGQQASILRMSVASQSGTMAYLSGASSDGAVVVQVDRASHEQVIVAKPAPYSEPRLSPDGQRIVVQMRDARGTLQIWVHDRVSTTTTQLTFDGQNIRGDWSPDGQRVAFSTNRIVGKHYIWSIPADGSDKGERVGTGSEIEGTAPVSWTRDGKWIVTDGVSEGAPGPGGEDVFAIPTSGAARMMRPAVATAVNEQSGEVSPDGKWIAYVSNDVGLYQVYVQPFLMPGGRTLVSAGPGNEPAWASNDELVYVDTEADSMVLARLTFGPTTTVRRTTLFDHRPFLTGSPSRRGYDVSRDGKTFVFVRPVMRRTEAAPVVVLNWGEEVRRLIAAAGVKP
jgi:eukaryotic-like serine/threonine-protein kinase